MMKETKTGVPSDIATYAASLGVNVKRLHVLDEFLKEQVEEGIHSFIAFRALRSGMLIFNGNYGVMAPGGPPLKEDGIHTVQSVTKPVVATMCAMLQEDGKIDFWDKAQKYFPDFVGEGKDEVILTHLLSHSSGMNEEETGTYIDAYMKDELGIDMPGENATEDEYLDAVMQARKILGMPEAERNWDSANELLYSLRLKAPLTAKPGVAFSYNNFCYQMLADIIEKVSGESMEGYARRKIFEPLGMKDSHWVLPKSKWSRVVKREPHHRGGEWMNSDEILTNTSPSGGLKTTMSDLARFGQMFLQNGTLDDERILSPASVRLMTKDINIGIPDSFWRGRYLGSNWGLGWDVKNGKKDDLGLLRSEASYNHCGYGGARLHIDPDAALVVAFDIVEQDEEVACLNHSNSMNVLYSALD
ncbi:MAG: beta-lactamase family protein [Oscillospiraceae bacterium]|nr:beta-lactamase family protein [Oscillospiraceae bacterium]